MNKLELYREQKANKYNKSAHSGHFAGEDPSYHYLNGFDAAIALELPVKFARWKDNFTTDIGSGIMLDETDVIIANNTEELYQYWLNNVYKFE